MILNARNYFSREAEQFYMSCSQYQNFGVCEAMAIARINGDWIPETPTAMKVGSYVHAHFEGIQAKREFMAETPEMFTIKGSLKETFKTGDEMIQTIENDELCMHMLQGDSEVILTAEMFGLWWKVRLDKYLPEKRRIVDIKTTKSIVDKEWKESTKSKANFIEMYDYPMRAAVYSEVERINRTEEDWLDFYLVAVSKEDPPDKAIIRMNDPFRPGRYLEELAKIEGSLTRIKLIKAGILPPMRCEKCQYCRSTKVLEKIIYFMEL